MSDRLVCNPTCNFQGGEGKNISLLPLNQHIPLQYISVARSSQALLVLHFKRFMRKLYHTEFTHIAIISHSCSKLPDCTKYSDSETPKNLLKAANTIWHYTIVPCRRRQHEHPADCKPRCPFNKLYTSLTILILEGCRDGSAKLSQFYMKAKSEDCVMQQNYYKHSRNVWIGILVIWLIRSTLCTFSVILAA